MSGSDGGKGRCLEGDGLGFAAAGVGGGVGGDRKKENAGKMLRVGASFASFHLLLPLISVTSLLQSRRECAR